jgi:dolichol-phosphate mannosyltransferase
MSYNNQKIAVVIPSYKVKAQLRLVIDSIPDYVDRIIVVNDCCPESSYEVLSDHEDKRICILHNKINMGVGGALVTGYRHAIEEKIDIVIKIDGDNQMDPNLSLPLALPLLVNEADYAKGSRFFNPHFLKSMPIVRLIGNSSLSLINKLVTGYWNVMDPTNGFTAVRVDTLKMLPLEKISQRYFFESDMLFRLSLIRARVIDFPMEAKYADEKSNLSITKVLFSFPGKYIKRFLKRLVYQYFLQDFNYGTIALTAGLIFTSLGLVWGGGQWYNYSFVLKSAAPSGTVVIPAMLIILGIQFIISFIHFDIQSVPKTFFQKPKA